MLAGSESVPESPVQLTKDFIPIESKNLDACEKSMAVMLVLSSKA